MNRTSQRPSTALDALIPETAFMDLQQFNSAKVIEHIENKEQHDKTVHTMLDAMLQQRKAEFKQQRNKKPTTNK
jgi:hypothetical protein